ncbi:MAG TPA: hypothetical protein VLA72_22230 [Anaerolineales bacterium]|nr:hypothetical protein [Anaerolineales bacterium]
MNNRIYLQRRIKILIIFFMIALTTSGLTAIPLQWEMKIIMPLFGNGSFFGGVFPGFANWLVRINDGILNGYGQYPFLAYGTDWLAFGHVGIAVAFIGPLRDPIKNKWVVEFGMIICMLVIPWAFIFGFFRNIPLFWTLIDICFGLFGIIPLGLARGDIMLLTADDSL